MEQSQKRSTLNIHWEDWRWSSNPLATWCEELTHWKRPWCWKRLRAEGEGDNRGWDGWMASPTQWTCVWVDSGGWWWAGRPGMLQSMGSQSQTRPINWTTDHVEAEEKLDRLKTWVLTFSFISTIFSNASCCFLSICCLLRGFNGPFLEGPASVSFLRCKCVPEPAFIFCSWLTGIKLGHWSADTVWNCSWVL